MGSVLGGDARHRAGGRPAPARPTLHSPSTPCLPASPRPAPRHQPHPPAAFPAHTPGTARPVPQSPRTEVASSRGGRASTQPLVPGCPTPSRGSARRARLVRAQVLPARWFSSAGLRTVRPDCRCRESCRELCGRGRPRAPPPALTERRPCGPGARVLAGARAPRGGRAEGTSAAALGQRPPPRLRRRRAVLPARRAARRQGDAVRGACVTLGRRGVRSGARRGRPPPPVAAALPRPRPSHPP